MHLNKGCTGKKKKKNKQANKNTNNLKAAELDDL